MDAITEEARRKYRSREPMSHAEDMAFFAHEHRERERARKAEIRRLSRLAYDLGRSSPYDWRTMIEAGVGAKVAFATAYRGGRKPLT